MGTRQSELWSLSLINSLADVQLAPPDSEQMSRYWTLCIFLCHLRRVIFNGLLKRTKMQRHLFVLSCSPKQEELHR